MSKPAPEDTRYGQKKRLSIGDPQGIISCTVFGTPSPMIDKEVVRAPSPRERTR